LSGHQQLNLALFAAAARATLEIQIIIKAGKYALTVATSHVATIIGVISFLIITDCIANSFACHCSASGLSRTSHFICAHFTIGEESSAGLWAGIASNISAASFARPT
jgi:hypothetical protein